MSVEPRNKKMVDRVDEMDQKFLTRNRTEVLDGERGQNEPHAQGREDRGPETRTTASDGRSCEQCGRPLTGRKERFCSDRCRMAVRREQERARVDELLRRLEGDLNALREELVGAGEVEP
jgi:predicted nucleic acid-binding Zn ribbon protein